MRLQRSKNFETVEWMIRYAPTLYYEVSLSGMTSLMILKGNNLIISKFYRSLLKIKWKYLADINVRALFKAIFFFDTII